jgi:hypothetical protein
MQNTINKDYKYIISKKNSVLLNTNKKFINCSNNFFVSKSLRFIFLELYQEGFVSNHYYGFSITSKRSRKLKLFRPSDRSFFKTSLEFPTLLHLGVLFKL